MKLAVIGHPIKHSLSPVMQQAALDALKIEGTYEAIEVKTENLNTFTELARRTLNGFNVTLPHKSAIIPYLNIVDPMARRAESVNTVSVENGGLAGLSTDGIGFLRGLREAFADGKNEMTAFEGAKIAFVGCGGAVQSVVHYLAGMVSLRAILLLNRTREKAEALQNRLVAYPYGADIHAGALNSPHLKETLESYDFIIQGTSLGLTPDDPLPLDPVLLPKKACVYDMIYWETPFLNACRSRGLHAADGQGMLLHQGAAAFSHWTKKEAPLEVMREALNRAIADRRKG